MKGPAKPIIETIKISMNNKIKNTGITPNKTSKNKKVKQEVAKEDSNFETFVTKVMDKQTQGENEQN